MKVKYGKLKKPSNQDCLRYCKDYKTCTLTECHMRKLIKNDKIIMADSIQCDYFDNRMKHNNWIVTGKQS